MIFFEEMHDPQSPYIKIQKITLKNSVFFKSIY